MNYIEIINKLDIEIEEKQVLEDFVSYCVNKLKLKNVVFNVIIINNEEIHKLNKKYRGIDRATDVITFALEDQKDGPSLNVRMLGDIYISYDKVISQALEYGHSKTREICFLAVHGLLHLLGYDHIKKEDEEKMFGIQKELLNNYGIKK